MKIPFIDLHAQYISIQSEVDDVVKSVLSQASYIGGHHVRHFEARFAEQLQINHCVGVGNGTDALYTILTALDLPAGAEVLLRLQAGFLPQRPLHRPAPVLFSATLTRIRIP